MNSTHFSRRRLLGAGAAFGGLALAVEIHAAREGEQVVLKPTAP